MSTIVEHTWDHRGMQSSICPRCKTLFAYWDDEDLDENGDLRCFCEEEHAEKFREVWVCQDCYSVHHFGEIGEDCQFTPAGIERNAECVRAYDAMGGDRYVSDNTDSETGEGIHEFSWSSCHCCNTSLGGSRYRLAVEEH